MKCTTDASAEAEFYLYLNGIIHKTNNSEMFSVSVIANGMYTCFPFLDAPGNTRLVASPSNTTVPRNSSLALTCETSASPEAEFHLYFNNILHKTSNSGMFNVTVKSDGVYTCVPINTVGTGENVSVGVTAVGKLTMYM